MRRYPLYVGWVRKRDLNAKWRALVGGRSFQEAAAALLAFRMVGAWLTVARIGRDPAKTGVPG